MAILGVLGANMPGAPMQPELAVMHHTDCGMFRLAMLAIQEQVVKRLNTSVETVAGMAITDHAKTVQEDIQRLRNAAGAPGQLVVSGLVYDVKAGTINQVVPPAPLKAE